MSRKVPIYEIVNEASSLKNRQDKIDCLRRNDSYALRSVLQGMYDKGVKFALPEGEPSFTPAQEPETHGNLYMEARRLRIFAEGQYPTISGPRRERMFVQLLEFVHPNDARLLLAMKDKSPPKGLPVKVVEEAFPGLIGQP